MRLVITHVAVRDVEALRQHIEVEQERPRAARKVVLRILRTLKELPRHPGIGRSGRVPNTRELVISNTPFIVPYRVQGDTLVVLRVLHGAMRWPDEL